jgi:regulator of replication initiation timing
MNRIEDLRDTIETRLSELIKENIALREENHALKNGLEGACYACEPVGELNQKLVDAGHALYHALGYFTGNFVFMNDNESTFTAEREAVNRWRELFDNDIPEQNYED